MTVHLSFNFSIMIYYFFKNYACQLFFIIIFIHYNLGGRFNDTVCDSRFLKFGVVFHL